MAKTFTNINEFNSYMKGIAGFIMNDLLDASEINANTAATLLSERIIDTGKKGDNKRIGVYATSTKKQKERKGKQSSFVNLQQSGEMWNNFSVIENIIRNKSIVTIVAGKNEITNSKLEWNADRYGDFLTLTNKEERQLAKSFDSDLQASLDKYF